MSTHKFFKDHKLHSHIFEKCTYSVHLFHIALEIMWLPIHKILISSRKASAKLWCSTFTMTTSSFTINCFICPAIIYLNIPEEIKTIKITNEYHFSLGLQQYICPRYDTYPNTAVTIRLYMIRYITRVLPHLLLVGSEVCTADKPSWKHACDCVCHLKYNAKHCSAWIFLASLFGKSLCIRTNKRN